MPGSNLILLNRADLGADNDGAGSGTDPTAGGGAVINVDEQARLAVVMAIGIPTATAASGADTLGVIIEASDDGGSTWARVGTFRSVLGSEIPTAADDRHPVLAIEILTPRAQAGQDGVIKLRATPTASDNEHWNVYIDVRTVQDTREEWLANAQIKTPVA